MRVLIIGGTNFIGPAVVASLVAGGHDITLFHRGETEPIDPVAGHIPNAVNRFYKANLNADLTFRPAEEIKNAFTALTTHKPAGNVVHYCGSGVTACANLFAMEYAGLTGSKLFAGSWSEWVADPSRPVVQQGK